MISIFGLSLGASVAIVIGILVVIGVVAFFLGITYRKSKFEKVVGSAEQQAKKIITIEMWFSIIGVAVSMFMIVCGIWAGVECGEDNPLLGIVLCVFGGLTIFVMAFVAVWCESIAGYYECKDCGHRHKPSYFKVLFAIHVGLSRKLRCPKCNKKNYHKKVYSADEE